MNRHVVPSSMGLAGQDRAGVAMKSDRPTVDERLALLDVAWGRLGSLGVVGCLCRRSLDSCFEWLLVSTSDSRMRPVYGFFSK